MTKLNFEFFLSTKDIEEFQKQNTALADSKPALEPGLVVIDVDATPEESSSILFARLVQEHHVPLAQQFELVARLKLSRCFPSVSDRRFCLQIRLVALSVLRKLQYRRFILLKYPSPSTQCR